LVPKLNNFEVSPDYRFIEVSRELTKEEVQCQTDLFVSWHWETDVKIGNTKERDFRYMSNFDSRVMYTVPYIELEGDAVATAKWQGIPFNVGRLLEPASIDEAQGLLDSEYARIDGLISKVAERKQDTTDQKVRMLVRRDRLRSVYETSVDLGRLDYLDLAETGFSVDRIQEVIRFQHFTGKVVFERGGIEGSTTLAPFMRSAYRWKYRMD
jgi:hypothetical protein